VKKYNRFIVLMLAIVLVLCFSLMFTGCSNNTEPSASGDDTEKITVVDGLGREITLDKTPERILTSYGIATQMVFTLGAQDRLVGIDSPSLTNKFLISLDPNVPNMATPGSPAEFNVVGACQ
jgi:iron complex transport system substrate-binding protein